MRSTNHLFRHGGGKSPLVRILTFALLMFPAMAGASAFGDALRPKLIGTPPADVAKLVDLTRKGADATAKVPTLDPSDDAAQADYDPPGMPSMPIGCGGEKSNDEAAGCEDCYRKAHEKLRDLRRYFEQLRVVYVETDDFTKAAIAFGDGVAGSVGVGALAWNEERGRIQQSFKQFRAAYKAKYEELLDRLDKVLHEIAACEAQHFGNEDWYNRYGFMFLTFMSLHYAR